MPSSSVGITILSDTSHAAEKKSTQGGNICNQSVGKKVVARLGIFRLILVDGETPMVV